MAPIPSPKLQVRYTKSDGSIFETTLERRKQGTYAIDLRKWSGGRPTLKPAGSFKGTKDLVEAHRLAQRELAALAGGSQVGTELAAMLPIEQANHYIHRKFTQGRMTRHTAQAATTCIHRCWEILMEMKGVRRWADVKEEHIGPVVEALEARGLKDNTVLKHLNYLKGFAAFGKTRGIWTGLPVHRNTDVPKRDNSFKREWLEPHEMGALLRASFAGRATYRHVACPVWPEILATLAYTGARESEVLGLMVSDLTFTRGSRGAGVLNIHPNKHRRLKNDASKREFALWPAHAAILKAYIKRAKPGPNGLLFPTREGAMWRELRGSMARDLEAAGIEKRITDHSLRHSYISARSRMYSVVMEGRRRTLASVHIKDVALEVGHGSDRMTREIYDHSTARPVEGWTELDYAAALRLFEAKGLTNPPEGRRSAKRSRRSASRRSTTGRGQ